jgi:hypothetical protein
MKIQGPLLGSGKKRIAHPENFILLYFNIFNAYQFLRKINCHEKMFDLGMPGCPSGFLGLQKRKRYLSGRAGTTGSD